MQGFFKSKIFTFAMLLIVSITSISLVRELIVTFKVKKEIAQLQQEAQSLESRNQELQQLVEYLNSPLYKETAAREHLNAQLPGEIAVALPNLDKFTSSAEAQEQEVKGAETKQASNALSWWQYFFSASK